jgi:hypothetical protein
MPTVKELIVQARAAGIRYAGLNKTELEEALRAHYAVDPLNLPRDALRHFDCDQEYALTGRISHNRYESRLEAAKNGHFACVKMMDENERKSGKLSSISINQRYDDNVNILIEAWNQGELKFIDWALNRSGNPYYIVPVSTWSDIAYRRAYGILASAILNYGQRSWTQLAPRNIREPPTPEVFSDIVRQAIDDLPESGDFLEWAVSTDTNPKYAMEFVSTPDVIDFIVHGLNFSALVFHLEQADRPTRRKIVARLNTLASNPMMKNLRRFLMANSHLIPKDMRRDFH